MLFHLDHCIVRTGATRKKSFNDNPLSYNCIANNSCSHFLFNSAHKRESAVQQQQQQSSLSWIRKQSFQLTAPLSGDSLSQWGLKCLVRTGSLSSPWALLCTLMAFMQQNTVSEMVPHYSVLDSLGWTSGGRLKHSLNRTRLCKVRQNLNHRWDLGNPFLTMVLCHTLWKPADSIQKRN